MNEITTTSPACNRKPIADGANTLCELPWNGKINIRGNLTDKQFIQTLKKILGIDLPEKPHTLNQKDELLIYWLGPNEWLIHCDIQQTEPLTKKIKSALNGIHFAVVDVSDYYTVLQLGSISAAQLLAKACPLDLHEKQFTQNMCTQTRFGHASILLHKIDPHSYKIQVRWSFAEYIWDYLISGMKTL